MQELKIIPHVGIGPILLDDSRENVRSALATIGFDLESSRERVDYFAEAAIQVEYGADDCADFIGVACQHDYSVTYFGTNVFDMVAEDVFALIAARDASGEHAYDQSGFVFPNQIVTLWEADEQYDRLGGEERLIWGQVGLGNKRYLDAINAIRSRHA